MQRLLAAWRRAHLQDIDDVHAEREALLGVGRHAEPNRYGPARSRRAEDGDVGRDEEAIPDC